MSNEAQAWARAQTVGGCGRKAVLMALANRADESWSCYPGQELIARETEQTSRTVRSHLEALEADGFIRREERRRQDGYRTSDRYFLLPENSSGDLTSLTGNERTSHRKLTQTSPETVSGQETKEEPSVEPQTLELLVEQAPKPTDFQVWYSQYPRKQDPKDAERAYIKARKEASAGELLAGLERYVARIRKEKTERKHIKLPATWLNKGSWLDEVEVQHTQWQRPAGVQW